MCKKLIYLSFFLAFCTTAMAADIAFYVGAPNPGWYVEAQMNADVATIIAQAGYMFNDIQQFDDNQLNEFGTWVDNNTNDGEMDIIWLNGCLPSVLYPLANASPDGSRAEEWLDRGNMIINVADWFAYCTYEGGTRGGPGAAADNGPSGAGNILDLPTGVIASSDGLRLPVTAKGYKYLPSLSLNDPFPTDRPVILSNVQAPWEVADIFAGNATQADPVVIHNTATDGYVAFINQATAPGDSIDDRGVTCAEFIINWVGTLDRARNPAPPDGATGVTDPLLTWQPGKGAKFHDVYLGTDEVAVTNATSSDPMGPAEVYKMRYNYAMWWELTPWIPGATYYWRIDEVEADNITTHTGEVWSFTAAPLEAYDPDPPDGARYVGIDADLSWAAGFNAVSHDVYFGTDETAVADGTGGTFKANQPGTSYDPGTLAKGTTYYWRIDEVELDNTTKQTGDVWRFSTIPDIVVTDPDLVGRWTFDEGTGTTALDWSGHENHGILMNGPEWWPDGYDGGALHFDGTDYVAIQNLNYNSTGHAGVTACAWIRTNSASDQYIISYDRNEYWRLEINGSGAGAGQVGWDVMTDTGQVDYGSNRRVDDGEWHHVAGVFDNGTLTIYIDGTPEPSATGGATFGTGTTRYGFMGANSEATSFNGSRGGGSPIAGELDDVRVYQKALTQAEIKEAMRANPLLAWNPSPANASTPDIEHAEPITWSPGDNVAKHDVYFGTDEDAVIDADSSDTTGVYRGRIDPNSYTPPEGLEFGQTYYWRIDQYNTDATVNKGRIWRFTVVDYLMIDDFDDYDDFCNRVFYTYGDGWGHNGDAACGVPPSTGNGTGSTVGYLDPPYAEQTITHHGSFQSMPMEFLNDGSTGKARYSETERTFDPAQDWTRKGVKALTLYFYGEAGNAAERMYVALEDSAGHVKVVEHPDPQALQRETWQEWNIELKQVSDAGVNLQSVKKMYIGVGNRDLPTLGGGGMLYIDDIRLYRPRCVPLTLRPDADIARPYDCKVDYKDLRILTYEWLSEAQLQDWEYRAAYWDSRYPVNWGGNGIAMRDGLAAASYTILNADQLKAWMDDRIADGKSSVVVICRDSAPETVAESMDTNCTIRRYLDAGGKVVWYADIPFYYQAHSDGTQTTWGEAGQAAILEIGNLALWDSGDTATITSAGANWGLTQTWTSVRAEDANDVDVILATDDSGNAAAYVKHYVPGDAVRGFVRLWDQSGGTTPPIADVIRVAEYGALAADLNGDGTVDFKDYALLADMFLDEELWP